MPAHSQASTGLAVGQYLEKYWQIWNSHFPGCARRADSNVITMLRFEEDAVPFAAVRNRLADLFGLDPVAVERRLRDLQTAQLITIASDTPRLHAQDLIEPTPKLYQSFDNHIVEACNRLLATVQHLGHEDRFEPVYNHSPELNVVFAQFLAGFGTLWGDQISGYLRQVFPRERAYRTKIERSLRTFAYWHILLVAWMSHNSENPQRSPFLFVDDFHANIYATLRVKWPTTKEYVQDMVEWGLLERRDAKHGVTKNQFAVEISEELYELIEGVFCKTGTLLVDTARCLQQRVETQAKSEDMIVLPFAVTVR